MTIFIQVSFLKSRDWTSKLNLCTENFPDGHPSIKAKETGIDMPQDPEIGNLMKILWAAIFAGNFMEFSPERELYLIKLGLEASA